MRITNRPITLVKIVEMSNDMVIYVATDCATYVRAGYVLYRALVYIVTTGKEEVSGVVPMPAAASNLSHHQFYEASYASFVKSS